MQAIDRIFKQKIQLPFKIRGAVLAVGSQTKNTVCFIRNNFAYISSVHADLANPAEYARFQKIVTAVLKYKPKIIACDLHPEYQSSKYIQDLRLLTSDLRLIQHHHAHIASCMLENNLKNEKVIGVAFDGTGLGLDGTFWGGEFFINDYKNFQRKASFKPVALLGSQQAILEPWRLAAFWLYLIYGDKFLALPINWAGHINKRKWQVLKKMYLSGVNCPLASSAGRLFDAAASLILNKHKAAFEAELAMALERKAVRSQKSEVRSYKFKIIKDKDKYIINPMLMFKQIVDDLKAKVPEEKIAYCFHLAVAEMIKDICLMLRKESKLNKIALSGGVFQNKLLLSMAMGLLYKQGFKVFLHKNLPCNDAGISLGQAVIAARKSC